jgi:hypothetical protein
MKWTRGSVECVAGFRRPLVASPNRALMPFSSRVALSLLQNDMQDLIREAAIRRGLIPALQPLSLLAELLAQLPSRSGPSTLDVRRRVSDERPDDTIACCAAVHAISSVLVRTKENLEEALRAAENDGSSVSCAAMVAP